MGEEPTDEERGKVVRAIEQNDVLIDIGYYGVPAIKLAEKTAQAKKMMREAMCCLMQARMSFQILNVGNGEEKEEHILALTKAEEFFGKKYGVVFGELETTLMVPEKKG
jgi:hypothetical protein